MKRESCGSCHFFMAKKPEGYRSPSWRKEEGQPAGECHRNPPQVGAGIPWPPVEEDDWCGEWDGDV